MREGAEEGPCGRAVQTPASSEASTLLSVRPPDQGKTLQETSCLQSTRGRRQEEVEQREKEEADGSESCGFQGLKAKDKAKSIYTHGGIEVRKTAAKNILMRDGTARRVPGDQAEELVSSGKARRFISNTIYRAMKLGIEVKDHGTRDDNGRLAALIKAARTKVATKKQKAEAKKKAKAESAEADD